MLDLVGINFRIYGISIDPCHRRRCFWRQQRAVWAISRSRHLPRSRRQSIFISCNRVNVNKPKLWNFDQQLGLPGHLSEVFDVGNVSSLRNTTVRVRGNCHYRQPRNNSHDCADVNRRKCGRYTRYLRNFDRQLGLSGRRRQCFWREKHVISSKNDGASESVITAVAVSHGACRHRLHFAISRKIRNFARSFRRLSCVAASRILLYTNTLYQMGQQEEPVIDTCSPRRQAS